MDAPGTCQRNSSLSSPRVAAVRGVGKRILLFWVVLLLVRQVEGYWCVARSDADTAALQTALDYACGMGGADCAPLQPNGGLCFLPNTFQAHASYAFNSFYQRKNAAPGSCDFGGLGALAQTDPSYGSCIYPRNPSTAGGTTPRSSNGTTPASTIAPITPSGSHGLTPGGFGPPSSNIPTTTSESTSSLQFFHPVVVVVGTLIASAVLS